MTYYAQRKIIKNGVAQANVTNKVGEREEMEKQFHLFCANAAVNGDSNDFDSCEWGTFEQGMLERKAWDHTLKPSPEPSPEPAEEA